MPVRLNSTGGGSVTLDVPATSGTFTINLPAASGSIVAADGSGNTTFDGNIAITGTARRITGDFSNATVSNRLSFVTSAVNTASGVQVLPNGTATASLFLSTNASDPTNASWTGIQTASTDSSIVSSRFGTGAFLPMNFIVGGSERMRITAAGQVAIGTSSPRAVFNVNAGAGAPSLSSDTSNIALTTSATSVELAEGAYPGSPFAYWMQVKQSTNSGVAWPLVLQPIGGNVGIGTASPSVRLTVPVPSQNVGTSNVFRIFDDGAASSSTNNNSYGMGMDTDTGRFAFTAGNGGFFTFFTQNTERARITPAGVVLVGSNTSTATTGVSRFETLGTTGGAVNDWAQCVRWNGQGGLLMRCINSTGTALYFENSAGGTFGSSPGTNVGSIAINTTSVTYNTSSDYRLKENVIPLTGAADRVQALKPYRFNFIVDPDRVVDGFLAHEAAEVVPEAVTGEKDAVREDGSIKPQGIDHSKLVPLLTAALQEALSRIETLEARLAAVEAR